MLKQVSDPRKKGVKLMSTDSPEIDTRSGWHVKSFCDKDGNWYEYAVRKNESRWYLLEV